MQPNPNRILTAPWVLAALAHAGCFTSELDPDALEAFACEVDDDCPGSQICNVDVCTLEERIPRVFVTAPEPNQIFEHSSFSSENTFVVRFRSNLLAHGDASIGGSVLVTLDNAVQIVDGVELEGDVALPFVISPTPGAHYLALESLDTHGTPFRNPEASFRTLFWLDDGNPHVAVFDPWPGAEIPADALSFVATVHALDFKLQASGGVVAEDQGHAHIHIGGAFPDCVEDPVCDSSYVARLDRASSPPGGIARLSAATGETRTLAPAVPGPTTLTAILRNNDHTPYYMPFVPITDDDGDVIGAEQEGELFYISIPIVRVAD